MTDVSDLSPTVYDLFLRTLLLLYPCAPCVLPPGIFSEPPWIRDARLSSSPCGLYPTSSDVSLLRSKLQRQVSDTPAFPLIFFPLVVHVHVLFLRAISPLHLPSCYIPSTPLPVLALPCNPYKCYKFCLSLLFSPEEAKLAKRREKKKLPINWEIQLTHNLLPSSLYLFMSSSICYQEASRTMVASTTESPQGPLLVSTIHSRQ